jgi:hypothetical protein
MSTPRSGIGRFLGPALVIVAATACATALLLVPPSEQISPLEPAGLALYVALAALFALVPGFFVHLSFRSRGALGWVPTALALLGVVLAEEGVRFALGIVDLEVSGWPITAAVWDWVVTDAASGVFFVVFLGIFTVVLDLCLMALEMIAMGLFLYGLILTGPTLGALAGTAPGALAARIVDRRRGRSARRPAAASSGAAR